MTSALLLLLAATPAPVTMLRDVVDLAAAADQTCALDGEGSVWCWGSNASAILLTEDDGDRSQPLRLEGLPPVGSLGLASTHLCVKAVDTSVWCWGMGRSTEKQADPAIRKPMRMTNAPPTTLLFSVPGDQVFALDRTGSVWTIGNTQTFKLEAFPWGRNAAEVTRRCVRYADGRSSCWLQDGQITLTAAVDVRASSQRNTVCIAARDGTVTCLGDALDDAPDPRRDSMPHKIDGVVGARSIALGDGHACAAQEDGLVSCWGANSWGQLGDKSGRSSSTPLQVPGLNLAKKVVAGSRHTCALLRDGTVWCWGADDHGQLGRGTLTQSQRAQAERSPGPPDSGG